MSKSADVNFWGPSAWRLMHAVAATFPDEADVETKTKYTTFFTSLSDVLPCPSCRVHYKSYLSKSAPDTTNNLALQKWVFELHNNVNNRRGVPLQDFEYVRDRYTHYDQNEMYAILRDSDNYSRVVGNPFLQQHDASWWKYAVLVVFVIITVFVLIAMFKAKF